MICLNPNTQLATSQQTFKTFFWYLRSSHTNEQGTCSKYDADLSSLIDHYKLWHWHGPKFRKWKKIFFFKKSDLPFHTAKLGRIEFSNLEMKTWSTDRVGVPGWSVHQGLWILVHILPLSCYATLDLSFLFFSCIALGCRAPNLVPLFYNESFFFFFLNGIWIILGSLVTPVYIFCSTIV